MITILLPIFTSLILVALLIGAAYFFTPEYSNNSAIYKVNFKPSAKQTYLQGNELLVIKSNKLLLIPILLVFILHILLVVWGLLRMNAHGVCLKYFLVQLLVLIVLLTFVGAVIVALNLKLKIYWNGLELKTFLYQKSFFYSDLDKVELHYFREYNQSFSELPGLLHHYYIIFTRERTTFNLYPMLFRKLDRIENAFTLQNPYIGEIIQKPPRPIELE